MPIPFTCPHCGKTTYVADQYAGLTGPCAGCGKTITLPPLETFLGSALPQRGLSTKATIFLALGISLVVVIAGAGVMAALLIPGVGGAREAARRMQCMNQMKQINLALLNYEQANKCFPPAYLADENGKPMHSWRVLILPYLDEGDLYKQYRFDEPWDGPHNKELASRIPHCYRCPSDFDLETQTKTDYAMIVGPHAISDGPTGRTFQDIKDGSSNTILIAEASDANISWLEPRDLKAEEMTFHIYGRGNAKTAPNQNDISSCHPNIANVGLADGSVRTLSETADPKTIEAMVTIDGGEPVDPLNL